MSADDQTAVTSFMPIAAPRGRKPLKLNGTDALGNPLPRYINEKQVGIRRENGARKLKRLTRRHYEIISRHLSGQSGHQIATCMRITVCTVSRILNDPMSQSLIKQCYKDREGEVDALVGNAVEAVRDVFQDGEATNRQKMSAVDKAIKLRETLIDGAEKKETAEDVIGRLFDQLSITGENVQVNIGEK